MPFGILEDRHMSRPPGTTILGGNTNNGSEELLEVNDTSHLKKQGNIVLNPQPSDSPNDPLNWPKLKKFPIVILMSAVSTTVASMSAMLNPAISIIAREYHVSAGTVSTWMIGVLMFWAGVTTIFTAAGSNVLGKRPFILASIAIMVLTCAWGTFAKTFTELAVLRTLQGVATAPYETMVTATISDLYFLHHRGRWLSIWNVVVSVGILVGQIVSGLVIQKINFHATFGIAGIAFVIFLISGFFIFVETTYTRRRPPPRPTTVSGPLPNPQDGLGSENVAPSDEKKTAVEITQSISYGAESSSTLVDEPEPYKSQLRIFRGRISDANFVREMIKPLPLLCFPAVVYGAIISGLASAMTLGISILSAIILTAPPYNLTPFQLGLTHIPPFIVGLIAAPISGWVADGVAKYMSRHNNGVYEPEFRLTLMAISIPLTTAAMVGYGESVSHGFSLVWVLTWKALMNLGMPFQMQAGLSYVLDCHTKDANVAFVAIGFFRSIFMFLSTSFLPGIMETYGRRRFFLALAACKLLVQLGTIPIYVYGKRFRSFISRSRIGRKLAQKEAEEAIYIPEPRAATRVATTEVERKD